jgi:hypothetical protein
MSRVIRPKKKLNLQPVVDALIAEQERIASVYFKAEFDRIVAPFEHDIKFAIESKEENGKATVQIYPTDEIAGFNAAGNAISGADLYNWLDKGTDKRAVTMPPDFTEETNPGSLSTTHSSYDRDGVFFKGADPIEAREFTKNVKELYTNTYRLNMKRVLKAEIGKLKNG